MIGATRQDDPLGPEKLQLFVAGLSGLPAEEMKKAKVLYIRNAISAYHAAISQSEAFQSAMGCQSMIPIFWPILRTQKTMLAANLKLVRERIQNAIDVWKDDLGGETFRID